MSNIQRFSGIHEEGAPRTPQIGTIAQKYNEAFSKATKASTDGRGYRDVNIYVTPTGFEALTRTQAIKEFIKTGGKVYKLSSEQMTKMVDTFRDAGYTISDKSEKAIKSGAASITSGPGILTTKKATRLFEHFSNPEVIQKQREKIVDDSKSKIMRDVTSFNTKSFGSNSIFRKFPTDDAQAFLGKCELAVDNVKKFGVNANPETHSKLDESLAVLRKLVALGDEISNFDGLNDCYGYNPEVSTENFDSRLLDNKIGASLNPSLRPTLEKKRDELQQLSKTANELDKDLSEQGDILMSSVSISVSSNAKRMLKEINQLLGDEVLPRNPQLKLAEEHRESIDLEEPEDDTAFADKLGEVLKNQPQTAVPVESDDVTSFADKLGEVLRNQPKEPPAS